MTTAVIVTIILFVANLLFSLVSFIVTNLFMKKMDRIGDGFDKMENKFDKMAERLEHYVKIQDHKEDLAEIKKRLEKLEDHE